MYHGDAQWPSQPPSPNSTFISQIDAAKDLGVSKVTLWRLIGRGDYPQPVDHSRLDPANPIVRKEHENYKAELMAARKNSARKAG